ncbi:PEX4 Protein PEROXIN-4 [Candida maltosa Xu316]
MAERRLFKEFNQYKKQPPQVSNHQIISLLPVHPDRNILVWEAIIAKPTKKDSPYYYGGQWKLHIDVPVTYPIDPPTIKFLTPIVHPNINLKTGEICLDILKKDSWSPAWNLEHLVVAILMLLDHPEPDSPLNIDAANLYRYDAIAFESLVQFNIWKNNSFFNVNITPNSIDSSNTLKRDISGTKSIQIGA